MYLEFWMHAYKNSLTLMRTLFLLCLLFTCWYATKAQGPRVSLHKELHEIKPFSRLDLLFDAQAGQTFILQIEVIGERPLKEATVLMPQSSFRLSAEKVRTVNNLRIKAEHSGLHQFYFRNKGLRKRKIFVKIEKELQQRYKDTLVLDTILFTTAMDTLRTTMLDTQRIPDIVEQRFLLAPTYQLNAQSARCYDLNMDAEGMFVAYWVGLGDESLKAYDELKALPPPTWLLQGVNEPIMAYALGLTRQLPESPQLLRNRLGFQFDAMPQAATEERVFYGIIRKEELPALQAQLQFCFKNFSPTSPIPVHLRIARLQLTTRETERYIREKRSRERYILKKIPIPPSQL